LPTARPPPSPPSISSRRAEPRSTSGCQVYR
jgi:hypothetical protein